MLSSRTHPGSRVVQICDMLLFWRCLVYTLLACEYFMCWILERGTFGFISGFGVVKHNAPRIAAKEADVHPKLSFCCISRVIKKNILHLEGSCFYSVCNNDHIHLSSRYLSRLLSGNSPNANDASCGRSALAWLITHTHTRFFIRFSECFWNFKYFLTAC